MEEFISFLENESLTTYYSATLMSFDADPEIKRINFPNNVSLRRLKNEDVQALFGSATIYPAIGRNPILITRFALEGEYNQLRILEDRMPSPPLPFNPNDNLDFAIAILRTFKDGIVCIDEIHTRFKIFCSVFGQLNSRQRKNSFGRKGYYLSKSEYMLLEEHIANIMKAIYISNKVRKVIRIFSSKTSWQNLYNVFDCIRIDMKGERKIHEEGWASAKSIELFRRTANTNNPMTEDESRHAFSEDAPPNIPMSLQEAESLIREILKKWTEYKANTNL